MPQIVRNCWAPGYAARYDEPWFRALLVETQKRYKEQDLARADAHRRWAQAMTLEARREAAEAFSAICVSQAAQNLSKPSAAATSRDPAAAIRGELGITARAARAAYEDPEALRRGRVALGLEDDLPEERG
jgi:hypothetical protein